MTPYPGPQQGWFGRNWKWFVPAGCLTLLIMCGAFVAGILGIVEASLKSSDAYRLALAKAQSDPRVAAKLGQPVQPGWFMSGNIGVSGGSGDADISIPISGPNGKGTIYVVAKKIAGEWQFETLQVGVENQPGRIDLLPARR